MGLFGLGKKKELPQCPLCGKEMKWNDTILLKNMDICWDCSEKLKESVEDEDARYALTVDQAKDILAGKPVEVSSANPEICPVCGGAMGEYATKVLDGCICQNCDRLMRGAYYREEKYLYPDKLTSEEMELYADELNLYRRKSEQGINILNYFVHVEDELAEEDIDFIRESTGNDRKKIADVVEKFGDRFSAAGIVDETFPAELKAGILDAGPLQAKKLNGKTVAVTLVAKGSFDTGDEIVTLHDGVETETRILRVLPCGGKDFNSEIAGSAENTAAEGGWAWLFLEDEVTEYEMGDIIAKR
ncbi:MAG: hypothetical protein ACI4LA_02495 [Emergencia sp.]